MRLVDWRKYSKLIQGIIDEVRVRQMESYPEKLDLYVVEEVANNQDNYDPSNRDLPYIIIGRRGGREIVDLSLTTLYDLYFIPEVILSSEGNKLKTLKIEGKNISELPATISELSNLEVLDMHDNNISELPATISELSNLEVLDLHANNISELPYTISKLTNLKVLNLSNNNISELPSTISELTNLEILILSNNKISELPVGISKLSKLRKLFIEGNLVDEVNDMVELGGLEELVMGAPFMKKLPEKLGCLSTLRVLTISEHGMDKISIDLSRLINLEEFRIERKFHELNCKMARCENTPCNSLDHNSLDFISELKNLKLLSLYDNRLKEYPNSIATLENVEKVILIKNNLRNIPESVKNMKSLKRLYIHRNPGILDADKIKQDVKMHYLKQGRAVLVVHVGRISDLVYGGSVFIDDLKWY